MIFRRHLNNGQWLAFLPCQRVEEYLNTVLLPRTSDWFPISHIKKISGTVILSFLGSFGSLAQTDESASSEADDSAPTKLRVVNHGVNHWLWQWKNIRASSWRAFCLHLHQVVTKPSFNLSVSYGPQTRIKTQLILP